MRILAIDPGNTHSAFVVLNGAAIEHGYVTNEEMRKWLPLVIHKIDTVAVEMIACYGLPVGSEVFDTCRHIGRIEQIISDCSDITPCMLIYRKDVKMHLCHSMKANDASIRQALIDMYGPGKLAAIGAKKAPGPLYGISGDEWAALAVGVTAMEKIKCHS